MSAAASLEAVRRFHDILLFITHEPVRTVYEISRRLDLPLSSTYLVVSEMERLNCLTRDENGFFLTGARLLKVGLDAHHIKTPAQYLPPLIRYLRDQTGETSFAAVLDERLIVGVTAIGHVQNHLAILPFQTFNVIKTVHQVLPHGLTLIQCEAANQNLRTAESHTQIEVCAMPLGDAREPMNKHSLLLCVAATAGQSKDVKAIGQCLHDAKIFFNQSSNTKNP